MLEHHRPLDGGEVRLVDDDEEPVGDVGEGGPHLAGQLVGVLAVEHEHDDGDDGQQRVQGGEQAPGPAQPELAERDPVAAG